MVGEGEHTYMENAQTEGCYAGFVVSSNAHPVYATKILSQWNKYDILIPNTSIMGEPPGSCTFEIGLLTVETYDLSPRWFNNIATLADSGNRARGSLKFNIYNQLTGNDAAFARYGGDSIRATPARRSELLPNTLYLSPNISTAKAVQIKKGDGVNSYRSIGANDASIRNIGTSGDIVLYNSSVSGGNKLAAGNTLNAQFAQDSIGRLSVTVDTSTANGYIMKLFTPDLVNNQKSYLSFGKSLASNFFYWAYNHNSTPANNYLSLQDNGVSPGATSFTYLRGGNVGVGTLTPATKFEVVGNLRNTGDLNVTNNIGVGFTTTPNAPLHIKAAFSSGYGQFSIQDATSNGNQSVNYMSFRDAANTRIGLFGYGHYIGATDANFYMANEISGGGFIFVNPAGSNIVTLSSAGGVRFHSYGAGTLTTDASGNITATSDERLKTNIKFSTSGIAELMKLNPITYSWNAKSGNETKGTYLGFSAQNVKASIPYGTGEMKDGYLTLQDRAIMATLVNAVKEQQEQINKMEKEIKALKKQQQ